MGNQSQLVFGEVMNYLVMNYLVKYLLSGVGQCAKNSTMRNPLHAGENARKPGIHPSFKPTADVPRSPKQGYQWPHEKDLCPPKIKKKKNSTMK